MIANKVKLKMGTGTMQIDPVFKDKDYNLIDWAMALSAYNAKAQWLELTNAESYGLFIVDPDGRAYFAPSKDGSFKVKCKVEYLDPRTNFVENIVQDLTVTIETLNNCTCTCEIILSS